MMEAALTALLVVVLCYLIGSFPSAYIAGRVLKGVDIRKLGNGNAGAANTYREIGARVGIGVLLVDFSKGVLAIVLAQALVPTFVVFLSGLAVVMGHNWPVFVGLRGGRGQATTIGVLLALLPQAMLILLAVCLVPFLVTRNTMLAGTILFVPLPLVAWWRGGSGALIIYSMALPCLVGITHLITTRHLPAETKKEASYMRRR